MYLYNNLSSITESFIRVTRSGEDLTSPVFDAGLPATSCVSIEARGAHDQMFSGAPVVRIALRRISDGSFLLLRHPSLPVMHSYWQTITFEVS